MAGVSQTRRPFCGTAAKSGRKYKPDLDPDYLFADAMMVAHPDTVEIESEKDACLRQALQTITTLQTEASIRDGENKSLRDIIKRQAKELENEKKGYEKESSVDWSQSLAKLNLDDERVAFAEYLAASVVSLFGSEVSKGFKPPGPEKFKGVESFVVSRKEANDLVRLVVDVDDFLSDRR